MILQRDDVVVVPAERSATEEAFAKTMTVKAHDSGMANPTVRNATCLPYPQRGQPRRAIW